VTSVYAVRQLGYLFEKIELSPSEKRVREAFNRYVVVDEEVRNHELGMVDSSADDLAAAVNHLYGDVLRKVSKDITRGDIIPVHGPGVTAEKLGANQRWALKQWPQRLDSVFDFVRFGLPSFRFWKDGQPGSVSYPEPGAEPPVRVVHVPKTLKTPRIIAVEPAPMQFMQQGIARPLVRYLEEPSDSLHRNPVLGMIGFTDQSPNRELAREGSITGDLATIDLKEASDRVSSRLVWRAFENFPEFREAIFACRSTRADVPGNGVIHLAKYASMGSALCFPIEAMVFLAIVFVGIAHSDPRPLKDLVKSYRGLVRVYGDDIVVPTDKMHDVIQALESFGLVVNLRKTFGTGRFRESCGGDYFDGQDVTPVRFRRLLPRSRGDAKEVVSLVAFRNLCYKRGLWDTCRFLDDRISSLLRGHYPVVEETSSILGRHSFLPYQVEELSKDTHAPRCRGWVQKSLKPSDELEGPGALLKWFSTRGIEPLAKDHLMRHGRPRAVKLKLEWRAPY
jgi:hypothetical protein